MKERGLKSEEAEKLLLKFGKNELKEISKNTPFKILIRQIRSNFIVYLLLFAVILSFFVGKDIEAYTIIFVILIVIGTGFIQEYRAEESLKALKKMIMPVSIVIRDGKEQEVESVNLVPGDIIVFRSGEKIPADCILLEQKDLLLNESALTGESREIKKEVIRSENNYSEINQLFMGTFVVNGKCVAKVIHTGMNTKFGKIAGMISSAEKELPLQKKINGVVKYMATVAIVVSLLTGILFLFRSNSFSNETLIEAIILMIALCVSAFPAGLPVVLTITLASGMHKMAKKNALVNRMSVIETLGETTVICSDKTGTITKGEMTVKKIFTNNSLYEISGSGYKGDGDFLFEGKKISLDYEKNFDVLFKAAALCNDSRIERIGEDMNFKIIGSPTEAALLVMASKARIFKEDIKFERIEEIPFNSERKIMSVYGKLGKEKIVYAKGALEFLLKKCTHIKRGNGVFRLNKKEVEKIISVNKSLTNSAYRTLALAYKIPSSEKESIEEGLTFIGLVGMEDPAREEVKDALQVCFNAGISVKMITGDNKETAVAIAKEIGLKGDVVEGDDLESMTDDELQRKIFDITIFARVKPIHKLRIVKALKANGEVVTMTGDGVNDSPALKEAHIGIAMGKNGTDVSREVSDIILKDDNFVTIVEAIKEGRTIFRNIRKFVSFQLSCNLAELTILFLGVLLAPFFGWGIPVLLALQILFMNLVTDNLPAITLGFNNSSPDIMNEPPRRKAKILSKNAMKLMFLTGLLMTILVLATVYFSFNVLGESFSYARTDGLLVLILLEIAFAFNFRSFRKKALSRSPLVNPYLFYASAISVLATIAILYTPLNKMFEVEPISLAGWLIALIPCLFVLALYDILKQKNNKKKFIDLEN